MHLRLSYILCVCLTAGIVVCGCTDYRALNDANPEFQKAEHCRQEGRYDLAIQHYEECLRLAPESYKAHLQLAMIYEDHKKDLPRAIMHYEAYLDAADAANLLEVRQLLERAQKRYLAELKQRFEPEPAEPSAVPAVAVSEPAPSPEPTPVATLPEAIVDKADQPQPKSPLPTRTYTVRRGDNLSLISSAVYGTSRHADRIFEANRDRLTSPDRLQVGQTLTIPVIENVAGKTE